MTDPYSLDYPGPLNLIWMHVGVEVPCTLHPDHFITANGCAWCRRIRAHLNDQLAAHREDGHTVVYFAMCPICGEKPTEPGITDHECDPDMPQPQYIGLLATLTDAVSAGQYDVDSPPTLFPEGAGALLRASLDGPDPSDGPPYTHTFRYPPTEYDDDGEPLPPKLQPSLTIMSHLEAPVQEGTMRDDRCPAMKLPPHPLTLTNLNREWS